MLENKQILNMMINKIANLGPPFLALHSGRILFNYCNSNFIRMTLKEMICLNFHVKKNDNVNGRRLKPVINFLMNSKVLAALFGWEQMDLAWSKQCSWKD